MIELVKALRTSKTFWLCVAALAVAGEEFLRGEASARQALAIAFTALLGIFIRHGIETSVVDSIIEIGQAGRKAMPTSSQFTTWKTFMGWFSAHSREGFPAVEFPELVDIYRAWPNELDALSAVTNDDGFARFLADQGFPGTLIPAARKAWPKVEVFVRSLRDAIQAVKLTRPRTDSPSSEVTT